MGKREREKWDLLSGQCSVLIMLGTLFLAGGVAGCLFAGFAGGEGAKELSQYLADYLSLARDGTAARTFWPTVWEQLRYLVVVVVLGSTVLGVVGIPLLFCVRGFFFSFSVSCFCRVFGSAGLIPALVLFGLPALLWGPALFLAGFQGLSSSQRLLRRGSGEGRCSVLFSPSYCLCVGLCGAMILACAGAEYFVIPVLLRAAARVVL